MSDTMRKRFENTAGPRVQCVACREFIPLAFAARAGGISRIVCPDCATTTRLAGPDALLAGDGPAARA